MYNEFYGFSTAPFHIMPDLDFLFMGPKHKQALASMEFGLLHDVGLSLITGEIGIGKTTLIRHFLEQLQDDVLVACIFNTNVTSEQLLNLILQAFEADIKTDNKAVAIQALHQFLKALRAQNMKALLILDDAQNLSYDALEEVRLLSNLQEGNKALIQIMMIGQPELKAKVANPAMASLAQRIGVNYHLRPFTKAETIEYITHRLHTVGGRHDLFTSEALVLIHKAAAGIPRTINLLCDNTLVYGYVDELNILDEETVQQVIDEIGGHSLAINRSSSADHFDVNPAMMDQQFPAQSQTMVNDALLQNIQTFEGRITALEKIINDYTKELHDVLNSQLQKERSRADKLLMEYSRLKAKLDAIKNSPTPPKAEKNVSKGQSRPLEIRLTELFEKNDFGQKKDYNPPQIISKLSAAKKKNF